MHFITCSLLTALVVSGVSIPAPAQGQWLINEVCTGGPDYVELLNVGDVPADPAGLCLWWHQSFGNSCSTAGNPTKSFRIPAGLQPVPPGGTLVLDESASGSFPCSVTIPGLSWRYQSELIIWINRDDQNPAQGILDMVAFGNVNWVHHTQGVFNPGGSQWSGGPVMNTNVDGDMIYRPVSPSGFPVDTNTPTDWRVAERAEGSPCATNPGTPPNPMTIGQGYSATGNCGISALDSMTSEVPALTVASLQAFDPRPGGSFTLSLRTGMAMPPTLTGLLFGNTVPAGSPSFFPPCVGSVVDYVDLATASALYFASPAWNADNAADLLTVMVPANPALVGIEVCFQAYMLDPSAGACLGRSTNGLQVTVTP